MKVLKKVISYRWRVNVDSEPRMKKIVIVIAYSDRATIAREEKEKMRKEEKRGKVFYVGLYIHQ